MAGDTSWVPLSCCKLSVICLCLFALQFEYILADRPTPILHQPYYEKSLAQLKALKKGIDPCKKINSDSYPKDDLRAQYKREEYLSVYNVVAKNYDRQKYPTIETATCIKHVMNFRCTALPKKGGTAPTMGNVLLTDLVGKLLREPKSVYPKDSASPQMHEAQKSDAQKSQTQKNGKPMKKARFSTVTKAEYEKEDDSENENEAAVSPPSENEPGVKKIGTEEIPAYPSKKVDREEREKPYS